MGIRSAFGTATFALKRAGITTALTLSLAVASISVEAAAVPNAKFSVGPDSNYLLLLSSLKSAKSQIWINIYEFDQTPIAALLIDKIRAGVELQVLIETQPCCNNKMTEDAKKIIRSLHTEMGKPGANPNSRIFLMGANVNPLPVPTTPSVENPPAPTEPTDPNHGSDPVIVQIPAATAAPTTPAPSTAPAVAKRRYRYNHAKFAVIDGTHVMISSENLTEKGHPLPGAIGNRGYTADLTDAGLVQQVQSTFREDTDTKNSDVLEVAPGQILPLWMGDMANILQKEPIHWDILNKSQYQMESDPVKKRRQKPVAASEGFASKIDYFFSPKSLAGLEDFITHATTSLRIEFMSMPATWSAGAGKTIVTPMIADAVNAAARGVKVKVLLNDERTFDTKPPTAAKGNEITIAYLEKMASCYKLPISAKIIDVAATGISYIHNKGMIADGNRVLISSINGTQNSVMGNRETAVAVTSPDLGAYYEKVHEYDWTRTSRAFSDDRVLLARALFPSCPPMPFVPETGATDPVFRTPAFGIMKFY